MLKQENLYGELKLFSSRTEKTSYFIDNIMTSIIEQVKILESNLRFKLYNIKIFTEDSCNLEIRKNIPILARCYNYLLLNTNFSSQHLLRKDIRFGHVVGICPTLSVYLFIQIIWYSKCEDLLIESIMHVPLDLCAEILETTIKHIDELAIPRARRLIFLLIYKIYNKFLWLHLGTLSEQNVMKCVHQIIMYFEILLNLLVSPKFVTSCNLSSEEKHLQHGILVKNILHYIKKCMYSKTRSYSKNHNLLKLFTLTYGNNEHTDYYHMLPINAVKCIIIRLDQILATLLLNQIKDVDSFEYIVWRNIVDNENTMISLHRAIIMECHYLRELMKQNDFLMENEQLFLCLKQLIGSMKSEESILTLQELCHDIAKGKLRGIKELIKRYKEWDLYTLDFIRQRVKFLNLNDLCVILEYLYYKLAHLHNKREKYQVYVSVLKILMHLKESDLHIIILEYMERHFDDNCLEYLYNEKSFDTFLRQNLLVEEFNNSRSMANTISQRCRILLIFILLNPRDVLNKLIFYEMNIESSNSILFQNNVFAFLIRNYYCLKKDQYTVLTYILKNIVLQQRMALQNNFWIFINKILDYQMITADDVMNELCIPYLINSHFDSIHIILLHIQSILQKRLCTNRTDYVSLTIVLIKKASLLRGSNATFSKFVIYEWMILINDMLNYLNIPSILTNSQYDFICFRCKYVEPLDMKIMQPKMNTLNIIQEYTKRCFPVYQLLRNDPQCHPKLRSYAQSFSLDREAFIRHVMLHSFEWEYIAFACELTFEFWYEFGWTDEMIAYENIIRITADVSQIVLIHLDTFPKCTFIMLLYAIINYCKIVIENMTRDKYKAICYILFRTLSSMNDVVSKTCYYNMYNIWLKRIQNINPDMKIEKYCDEICKWIDSIFEYEIETIPFINKEWFLLKMDQIFYLNLQTVEDIRALLSPLQQQHGQLKLLSCRAMNESLRSTDEVSKMIMYYLKDQLGMYNIEIFIADNDFNTKHNYLSMFITCYKYLLLNTNFSSQYLLRKDVKFGHVVGIWPTLSPCLFVQILWYTRCEDLLIESLVHIPLDLCVEILRITIEHINGLTLSRARRLILLLIYKIYYKCLWLHFGTISIGNIMKCIHQLITYFEILLNLLVPKFITSYNLSIRNNYLQHGILVKNILQCIKKCISSKIKNYFENCDRAMLFRLTYGNFNEHTNYYHILPSNEVKSIIVTLDQKLVTLLLSQIKHVDSFECTIWRNVVDDENTMISLHRAIIIECHYLNEFIKQNNFFMESGQLFLCLKQLIGPMKSEESILTLQELCLDIAKGKLHGVKELIKRYKEWDQYTLDFIRQRVKFLHLNDFYVILEYLNYKFAYLHTKTEKYRIYVSVLKILIHLKEHDLHSIILQYMGRHFDDNCLEYLYNEKSFDTFLRQNLLVEEFNNSRSMANTISQRCRILLIFILLNPRDVLSKLMLYEMNVESSDSILFQSNMFAFLIRNYYNLKKDHSNVLMYILKNIVLQQRTAWHTNFRTFINTLLDYQMVTVDDVIQELYIPYLRSSYFEEINIHTILLHVQSIVTRKLYTYRTNFTHLIIILIKKTSLLRKFNAIFSKFALYKLGVKLVNNIIADLFYSSDPLPNLDYETICLSSYHIEPLDIKKMRPMNTMNIIQEYERRCLFMHRRLRTDPRCHPKLRTFVQSFKLNREAFIRHIMLHCYEKEYIVLANELTFVFWYEFGWTDKMMAYENIIRITADVSQVALMYLDTFPKHTFIMLLYAIVKFSKNVIMNMTSDKHKTICYNLLRTLSSINTIVTETYYGKMYDLWLKRIQNIDPHLEAEIYFDEIHKWMYNVFEYEFETMPPVHKKWYVCFIFFRT
ncbi:hypothetical protein ALC57_02122 [Trachymyrmex cornetzi]|uniref:Uncharacterized protein n=1 Tax=Trachymyrmex cornetzi TaxID=471704 RepID=A0A195EJG8_9HYME|nr:hypothetical protein ALC57_02122 [Trachymyrmex cornetzi]